MTDPVVLVEHERLAAEHIERALAAAGFAVHRVVNGAEGLEYLRTNVAACIVLDHDQPLDDGFQILHGIRALQITSPVIMMSSSNAADLIVKAIKADAFDFVVKQGDYGSRIVEKVREAIATGRERVTAHRVVRPTFVGREPELRVLDDELARVVAGEGRVVLITGDEGIGKTSLTLELANLGRARGCSILRGQCHEAGGAPAYWPWTQILRAYRKAAEPEALAGDLGDSMAALAWIAPTLRPASAASEPEPAMLTRFQIVDGVTQFLRRVAARRPLVLVLDDLHRADGDSAHLFRFVASECADVPILIAAAYRDDTAPAAVGDDLTRVASLPLATVLRLGRFDAATVRRYVEEATGLRPSSRVVDAIFGKTDGHPLFVAEVTRLLATDGRLSEPGSSGELRLAIPATRRHAIADRLTRLSEGCRAVLGVAAVLGHEFSTDVLGAVMRTDGRTIRERLSEAVNDHQVAASDEEPSRYRFTHVLVRDVTYDALAPVERRALHRRIADVLEARAGETWSADDVEAPLAAIAHHCREGAATPADHERALHWVVAAGDHAALLMAHDDAARHFDAALLLLEKHRLTTQTTHDLLAKLADARRCAGDTKGARAAGRRALMLAETSGDPDRVAAAALAFAGRLPRFGAMGSTSQVAAELERALERLPESSRALRAQLMARLAEERAHGQGPSTPGLARAAIDLARATGDPGVLAAVLRTMHSALWTPGDIEWRPALADEIVALAARTGDRLLGMNGQLLRLWSALERGNVEAACQQLGVCQQLARAIRLPHFDWVTAAARICLSITMSRLDEAERLIDDALAKAAPTEAVSMLLIVRGQREHVRFLRGTTEDLTDWSHFVLTNFPNLAPTVECFTVWMDTFLGHPERARGRFATLMENGCARVRRDGTWPMNMAYLAGAAVLLEDSEAARTLYDLLAPFAAYNVLLPPCMLLGPVAHHLAGLAALLGDEAAARRHFEDALVLAERSGTRHWLARTLLAYGRHLLTSADPDDVQRGRALVESGRTLAISVDAQRLLRGSEAPDDHPLSAPRLEPERTRFFHRDEDAWEVEFRGLRATVPARAGMAYLRCLLERPGVPVPAIELASLGRDAALVSTAGGPAADHRALVGVRQRLIEIDAEITARARRNESPSPDLLHERRECARYLSRRGTELIGTADRARSGVTKAITRAIATITRVHPALGHHLARHVETGRLCMYVADPAAPVVLEQ